MVTPVRPDGRRSALAAAAVAALLALVGVWAVVVGAQSRGGPPQPHSAAPAPSAAAVPVRAAAAAPTATPPAEPVLDAITMVRSRPVALTIPSIGVSSTSLVALHKNPDGSLQVPSNFGQPGWYADGAAPGQFGPAVLAGHVDSKRGPGIFFRLGALEPGALVRVSRADGSVARFSVDRVERYAKNAFPTDRVYGDTTHRSELRLITCGGAFDRRTGHYVDNVVAYAHLL